MFKCKNVFLKLMGPFFFLFCHLLIFFQIYVIEQEARELKRILKNEKFENTYFDFFKTLLYFNVILVIISHLQASFTKPGYINEKTNLHYLEFYLKTKETALKRAQVINNKYKHLIRPPQTVDEDEYSDDVSDCENDEHQYTEFELLDAKTEDKYKNEHGVEITKCKKCFITRVPGVHHCSICKSCVYSMDHHCPWINNCIGQFNLKFFIQFCFYCFIACIIASSISFYYVIAKIPLM